MCDHFRLWWGYPPQQNQSWWLRFAKFALHHNCWVGPANPSIPSLVQHRVTIFGHEIFIWPWNSLGTHGIPWGHGAGAAASWGHCHLWKAGILLPAEWSQVTCTGSSWRHRPGRPCGIFEQHRLAIAIKVTTLTGNVAFVNGAASDWIILEKEKPWKTSISTSMSGCDSSFSGVAQRTDPEPPRLECTFRMPAFTCTS